MTLHMLLEVPFWCTIREKVLGLGSTLLNRPRHNQAGRLSGNLAAARAAAGRRCRMDWRSDRSNVMQYSKVVKETRSQNARSHSALVLYFTEHRQSLQMADASDTIVNSLHPSVIDKIDPDFARIYNRYQGSLDEY